MDRDTTPAGADQTTPDPSTPPGALSGLPPRRPVEFDVATGSLVIDGVLQRRVRGGSDEQVYEAYLSLLYSVRGARRGQEIPLRASDVEALLAVVGDDPEHIEQRLVELMHCTGEEAALLRRVLLRHRVLASAVGAAAGLSLVALVAVGGPSAASSPGGGSSSSVTVTDSDTDASTSPSTSPTAGELSGTTSSRSTDPRTDAEVAEAEQVLPAPVGADEVADQGDEAQPDADALFVPEAEPTSPADGELSDAQP